MSEPLRKYKVASVLKNFPNLKYALELQEEYGLWYLTTMEIAAKWIAYSESMEGSWIVPTKETVEDVFGIELEEIK